MNTVLPCGLKRIDVTRALTTECTAVLMPWICAYFKTLGGNGWRK